jgi:integrase
MSAIEPLPIHRMREQLDPHEYVHLAAVRDVTAYLPVVSQLLIWLERCLGVRISEGFGPLVEDFSRDEHGRGWLRIDKQGGLTGVERNPLTGELETMTHKHRTKTRAGQRGIPLPHMLADLLEAVIKIFHTDLLGSPIPQARLVPGIGKDDAAGQSTYRTKLRVAREAAGAKFLPHALRGSLITDMINAGIDERVRFAYAGHENEGARNIQARHYDQGVPAESLLEVAELLDDLLAAELTSLGPTGLIMPTTQREQWGRDTRLGKSSEALESLLLATGWWIMPAADARGPILDVRQVQDRLGVGRSSVMRYIDSGELQAFQDTWGSRQVWKVYEDDLREYIARRGTALASLVEETGWDYHPLWQLSEKLGLAPHRQPRHAVLLTDDEVERLLTAVSDTETEESSGLTVAEAASMLQVSAASVDLLLDHGYLALVPTHDRTNRAARRIDRASASAYLQAYPIERAADEGPTCTLLQAASHLGCDRRTVPRLIDARILATIPTEAGKAGRVRINLASLLAFAERGRFAHRADRIRGAFAKEECWATTVTHAACGA